MEYYAGRSDQLSPSPHMLTKGSAVRGVRASSCYQNGSLALVFLPISQNSRNIVKSPTHAASMTVATTPAAAANSRVALLGTVDVFYEIDSGTAAELAQCYTESHPDAAVWLPGVPNAPHRVRNHAAR